jgi:uncharacterized protein YigE (DUF2233 family)
MLVVVSCLALAALGSTCGNLGQCECFPCQSAIVLNVFDEDSQPLTNWSIEASVDGAPVDTTPCAPEFRINPAGCSFGFETGVYRITVQSPGFRTRQIAARFAAQSGEDCCRCLQFGATVNAFLERE